VTPHGEVILAHLYSGIFNSTLKVDMEYLTPTNH